MQHFTYTSSVQGSCLHIFQQTLLQAQLGEKGNIICHKPPDNFLFLILRLKIFLTGILKKHVCFFDCECDACEEYYKLFNISQNLMASCYLQYTFYKTKSFFSHFITDFSTLQLL